MIANIYRKKLEPEMNEGNYGKQFNKWNAVFGHANRLYGCIFSF